MNVSNTLPGNPREGSTLDIDVHPVACQISIYAWTGSRKRQIGEHVASNTLTTVIPRRQIEKLKKHCETYPGEYVIIRHSMEGRDPFDDAITVRNTQMLRVIQGVDTYFDQKFKLRNLPDGIHVSYITPSGGAPYDRHLVI